MFALSCINIIWTTFEAKVATQFVQNHVAEKESAAMIFMIHPYECRYFKLEIFHDFLKSFLG